MSIAYLLAELRNASDEELVRLHDEQAPHTEVGVKCALDEL
ncbi:hypothetical protein [Candidatus Palauibacter sp.]